MSESLFDIFGDNIIRQVNRNVTRQPLSNVENMGKMVSSGPVKPNEPVKRLLDPKKSFLLNSGKSIQSTPLRKAFTPRAVNVGAMIYSDKDDNACKDYNYEDLEFTKPTKIFDNYHMDMFDTLLKADVPAEEPLARTPPPASRRHSMEFDCSYQDEFFTDDFSNDTFPDDGDLGLPPIY